MAKYFLGSVGSVEAFKKKEGSNEYELAFVSKTLTDSGINTTISKEDIRGGTGAPVQFSFFHDPEVAITLTDVVFKEEYLEAQLGAEFVTNDDPHSYASETRTSGADGSIELEGLPVGMNFGACGGELDLVWATEVGKDDWKSYKFAPITQGKMKISGFKANTKYCIRYCKDDPMAKVMKVTSNIIPAEYMLIITAPIFAGDACAASNGRKAGTITYEIPRFRLNGGSEMAFNMSSNQTMSLAGTAYATDSSCEMGEQNLFNVIIKYDDPNAVYTDLIVDEDCLVAGQEPIVYGLLANGRVAKIGNDFLTFAPALAEGKFAAPAGEAATGEVTITLKDTSLTDTVTISKSK